MSEIISVSEKVSEYRTGIVEGIVLKTSKGEFLNETWKVVNKHFERTTDFSERMVKNQVV